MIDIFISYNQKDFVFANNLYTELQRFRIRGFMDKTDVSTGVNLSRQLKEAITNTDALLVILSKAASTSSWVLAEIGLAQSLGKTIFPILAPGQTYEESVPPQLLDKMIVDANSLSIEHVAARIVATATNSSVESALEEVQSRAGRRKKIWLSVFVALTGLTLTSVIMTYFAIEARNSTIEKTALIIRLEAELNAIEAEISALEAEMSTLEKPKKERREKEIKYEKQKDNKP